MSSVALSGNASGAGVFTIASPNSASSYTLTLPTTTGTLIAGVATEAQGGTGTTVGYNGFKNRIINGAMVIDQRNAGASVTPTNNQYLLDRYYATLTQASKFTVQQNAGSVTPPVGFTKYLGVTSSSAYSVLTGDTFAIAQYIEGFNIADLAYGTANAKTTTLSFQVYSSLTGTFGGALVNGAQNRSYPFTYTISSANTWTQISVTVAGDTTGTWTTDNSAGLGIRFGLGSGATYTGTAGAWAAGNFLSATGATSVVGTNGATFYITGVQLEKGSTATSFDYRDYGTELFLCQRYFEMSYDIGTVPASANTTQLRFLSWAINGNNAGFGGITFQVPKRAAPTVTTYDGAGTVNNLSTSNASANPAFTNGRAYQGAPGNISTSGFIHWGQGVIGNVNNYIHFIASAEL